MPKPLFLKRRSGLYVRFLVPGDLQGQIGSRFILRSLPGARSDTARLMASALGYALANVFERLRREDVSNARSLVDQALQGIQSGRDYTVELPNGVYLPIQLADLYIGSLNRRLNGNPDGTHAKDRFAQAFLDRFAGPWKNQRYEQGGDMTVIDKL